MLQKKKKNFNHGSSLDNGDKVLNISSPISKSLWIIDYNSIDYMIFDSKHVSYIYIYLLLVLLWPLTFVIREGSLTLTNTFNLDYILIDPSLHYNLLSIF